MAVSGPCWRSRSHFGPKALSRRMILRPCVPRKRTVVRYEQPRGRLHYSHRSLAPGMSSRYSLRSKFTASIKTSPLSSPIKLRAANSCVAEGEASFHRPEDPNRKFEPTSEGRGGPSTAVHPVSPAVAGAVGSFVRQRGHRKMRPSGSIPRWDTRPHAAFGQCTISVVMMFSPASLPLILPN